MTKIKYVLLFGLCVGGCMKSTHNDTNQKNIDDQGQERQLDSAITIGIEKVDHAFIEVFYQRFRQFKSVRKRVVKFYAERDKHLAWTNSGVPIPHARLLVNIIKNFSSHGLSAPNKNGYNISDTLSAVLDSKSQHEAAALRKSFDLALTSLFFQYAPKMWQGAVDPNDEDKIEWFIKPKHLSYRHALDSILNDSETKNPFIDYRQFNPQYLKLKEKLKLYSDAEKKQESTTLELNKTYLSKGDSSTRVKQLSEKLTHVGDLPEQIQSDVFSSALEKGVKKFQTRHGLTPDGVVGQQTLDAINVSLEDRIRQIIINMERWRWVPPGMNGDYIYVNIPQFELSIYQNDKKVDRMKVIVGKEGAETVLFSDIIKYIVVNPHWNIPKSIAIDEMLPRIKENKDYLADADIEVGIKWNFDVIDQDTINWNKISESNFNYTLRKKAGPDNPLGRLKFIFPNDFAIYLHDTPGRKLFDNRERGFSHGCIRVEKPLLLADRLLNQRDSINIQKLLEKEQDKWITLSQRMPIYILYFTTWVDEHDQIHFRDDIYNHDSDLASVLFSESL